MRSDELRGSRTESAYVPIQRINPKRYRRPVAVVPESLRGAVGAELRSLVRGERPELLTWVREYGARGATLIEQPDDIWTHRYSDVTETDDGGWFIVVPLWTTEESPSDLSAELAVASDGTAHLLDVHVL